MGQINLQLQNKLKDWLGTAADFPHFLCLQYKDILHLQADIINKYIQFIQ